ncbi:TrmB family transcriptional regulator [Natronobacterium texcoconense]|uniref:Sugar-specific transcriptional regulator TrmB n=1 Tax=Natronobacterium texcoconense TaxID=1095778 RepID=A0A1H1FSB8_NATTX|nr:TrmB family transcriptional regulator [Natronobacterium texcoconense]SDR03629.1 Sugar-specific transcriptional regulator TrmB [Natronobacterium texcoconense]
MDTDTLRRALEESGLTEYEVDAYLTLLEVGSSSVVGIAERSSVPAPQIYDTVRALEERGFVETIERDKLHARAREPVEIIDELREKSQMLADAADEVEERWERPDEQDFRVNVLKRRESLVNNAREAIENANVSVEVAATPAQLEQLQPALRDATDRGVKTWVTLCGDGESVDAGDVGVLQVRWRKLPGPFIAIVDRRRAFFAPATHHGEPYGIVINDDILTLVLHWFYLTLIWLPSERRYVDADRLPTYVSIEGFILDVAPLWYDGATIDVRVLGQDPETGEYTEVQGELTYIAAEGGTVPSRNPTVTELSGYATLVVDDDGRQYSIGGWGAVFEDVEAEIIAIEGIEFPTP